jgi:hypothetical protein
MQKADPNKLHNDLICKLALQKENLIKELNDSQSNFQNISSSYLELQIKKNNYLKELNQNKLISIKLKKEIDIKRKFLEGVHQIQIPLFNNEIETDFQEISSKIDELKYITEKLLFAHESMENNKVKINLDKLIL